MEQIIIYRGHQIKAVPGGWQIDNYTSQVFVTPEAAKGHIALLERPQPDRSIMVNGQPYLLSDVTSVSLLSDGKYGLSIRYKPAGGAYLR